jgi:hypothetical protein
MTVKTYAGGMLAVDVLLEMDDLGNYLTQTAVPQHVFEGRDGRRLIVMKGSPRKLRFWLNEGGDAFSIVDLKFAGRGNGQMFDIVFGEGYEGGDVDEALEAMLTGKETFLAFAARIRDALDRWALFGTYPTEWFFRGVLEADVVDDDMGQGMTDNRGGGR